MATYSGEEKSADKKRKCSGEEKTETPDKTNPAGGQGQSSKAAKQKSCWYYFYY
ncbi:MAG: hypothetical protein V4628_07180 [Pseudomonadota bacterium]